MLKWLNENINWEDFRPILATIYDKERKSNAGRKPTDVIVMFKLLILQQMYAISDDELEFPVHDRISFADFTMKHTWIFGKKSSMIFYGSRSQTSQKHRD